MTYLLVLLELQTSYGNKKQLSSHYLDLIKCDENLLYGDFILPYFFYNLAEDEDWFVLNHTSLKTPDILQSVLQYILCRNIPERILYV